jgi:hypothetical protein
MFSAFEPMIVGFLTKDYAGVDEGFLAKNALTD